MSEDQQDHRRYDHTVDPIAKVIDQQAWLDRYAGPVQQGIARLYQSGGKTGTAVANTLHGVPLGTPLHPLLVTIPIGAWTAASVLDALEALGRRDVRAGADIAVQVGIVGATVAAAAGLTDWHKVGNFKLKRRVGFVHGTLNSVALLMYTASAVHRARGSRSTARTLAWTAFGIVGLSGHLGGGLVYKEAQGVSHATDIEPPNDFTPVLADADLPENTPTRAKAGDVPVVLVRQGGEIHALAETCTHLGGPLADGELEDGSIRCPWHGSRFRLSDGTVLEGPSPHPQPCFQTRVRDGQIEVRPARSWD